MAGAEGQRSGTGAERHGKHPLLCLMATPSDDHPLPRVAKLPRAAGGQHGIWVWASQHVPFSGHAPAPHSVAVPDPATFPRLILLLCQPHRACRRTALQHSGVGPFSGHVLFRASLFCCACPPCLQATSTATFGCGTSQQTRAAASWYRKWGQVRRAALRCAALCCAALGHAVTGGTSGDDWLAATRGMYALAPAWQAQM